MSAFSRGLSGFLHQNCLRLPSSIRVAPLQPRIPHSFPGFVGRSHISTSLAKHAKASPHPYRPGKAAPRYPASNPILRLVESTGKPVLLYKAPERGMVTLATYTAALLFIGGGCWTFHYMCLHLPEELPEWVRVAYAVISVTLIAIGMWVTSFPVARLRCIQAVLDPTTHRGLLRLEGKVVPLPFIKPQVQLVRIGTATVSEKTRPVVDQFREVSLIKTQNISYGLEDRWAVSRPFIYMARFISRGLLRWFVNTRMAFTRFGILYVQTEKERWKLDASGWLLDDGKGLDSVMPVR